MNLGEEVIKLFKKAMESGEYFNPNMLQEFVDIIEVYHSDDSDDSDGVVPDDIRSWIRDMWER